MSTIFKGVLFDLDGTLLDTADDLGAALNHVLESNDFPIVNPSQYRPIASDGAKGLLHLGFGNKIDAFNEDSLRQQFLSYYEANIAVHTKLYEGVTELLAFLNQQGVPWGIVTNKPIGLTNTLLPYYPELSKSYVNIGGDSLPSRKPAPEPLLHACQHLHIKPNECVYLGDAPRDIQAANAADMYSVIALWGYIVDQNACANWSANLHCSNPKQLINLFRQLMSN
ncbi:HAD family hydrolase [Thalassotalea atypica]|uniref:HAD family hydrolase n=1 Tax=Thalassotalea atypica TaxID=2054316 RepID=UPI002573E3D5|nr:HAD-IA family hydrolase [Thalassotalea atypica]